MKQKKLKFTFLGIGILVLAATGWILKGFEDTTLWIAWMSEILGLITVYTVGNSIDKKTRVKENENKLDKGSK